MTNLYNPYDNLKFLHILSDTALEQIRHEYTGRPAPGQEAPGLKRRVGKILLGVLALVGQKLAG